MSAWRVGLLPYAVVSAAVVIVSAAALVPAFGDAPSRGLGVPSPSLSVPRPSPVDTGRLAYWRTGASGRLDLWISDLGGGRRWAVASAEPGAEVALTRWSVDGERVAYVVGGAALGVARATGGTIEIGIPAALAADHWKIVSLASPSRRRPAGPARGSSSARTASSARSRTRRVSRPIPCWPSSARPTCPPRSRACHPHRTETCSRCGSAG